MIVIALFVEYLLPNAGYSYLDRDHDFSAIGEPEWGFSRLGSCCGSVSPQDIGQFFRPNTLRVVQLGFDDLEQCPIRHLCLSFTWGCPGEENWFLMPRFEQKSLKPWLSNCCPFSDIIVIGIPNLQIIFFHTKLQIFTLMIVARASASTYFVK